MSKVGEIKEILPWWLKLTAKLFLARLPVRYYFWKRLGIFEHGLMDQPKACFETFKTHLALSDLDSVVRDRQQLSTEADFVVLELGPGDSLYTALIARSFGAAHTILVDSGDFATRDTKGYGAMVHFLGSHGYRLPFMEDNLSIEEIMTRCNATYLTHGLQSLREIPSRSVDFIFSNAVLEHVRKREMRAVAAEMRRCLKPEGRCSHRVDLQDHLGGALNNLRFSEDVWESEFMAKSGFYTNRIRYHEFLELFRQAGFKVDLKRTLRWDRLPTPRNKLNEAFRSIPDDDLLVYGFDVVLQPTGFD
jgi:SAM-dependent methyltransferase